MLFLSETEMFTIEDYKEKRLDPVKYRVINNICACLVCWIYKYKNIVIFRKVCTRHTDLGIWKPLDTPRSCILLEVDVGKFVSGNLFFAAFLCI